MAAASALNNKLSALDRKHIGRVKELPCSVCDAAAPSEAHHINQDQAYTCVALCKPCHDALHGNGDKAMWRIYKLDEVGALNITIRRLLYGG